MQAAKYPIREVLWLSRLNHPHVIKFHELLLTEDHIGIVMEYMQQGSFRGFLKERKGKRLSENKVRKALSCVSSIWRRSKIGRVTFSEVIQENCVDSIQKRVVLIDDMEESSVKKSPWKIAKGWMFYIWKGKQHDEISGVQVYLQSGIMLLLIITTCLQAAPNCEFRPSFWIKWHLLASAKKRLVILAVRTLVL